MDLARAKMKKRKDARLAWELTIWLAFKIRVFNRFLNIFREVAKEEEKNWVEFRKLQVILAIY